MEVGEAHEAVDFKLRVGGGVLAGPVGGAERGVGFVAAERAQHVEVGEPPREEVGDAVMSVYALGPASGDDHLAGHLEVALPGDGDLEGVGGDDLEACEHDHCGQGAVGYVVGVFRERLA